MKQELESVWTNGKLKNREKIRTLVNRYIPREGLEKMRGIGFTDDDLEEFNEETECDPTVYGNVELSENEKHAMRMHPNYMMYDKIDEVKVEVEIEKALTKARYCMMNDHKNEKENEATIENESEKTELEVFCMKEKVANYSNLRVTELPTVQRLYPPKSSTINKEVSMLSLKDKILRKVSDYKEKKCNDKGWIRNGNISKEQASGLKQIKERMKNKEVVVFSSDKSSKLTVDTVENYTKAIMKHAKDDLITDKKKVMEIERKMNHYTILKAPDPLLSL